jgi:single-strand DNA-binding protein
VSDVINVVVLRGNLGADPQLRSTADGKAVASFSLAVGPRNEAIQRPRDGFHRCVAFGALAETVADSLKKGSHVEVYGRMVQNSWVTDDGSTRARTDVILNAISIPQVAAKTRSEEEPAEA